MGAIFSTPRSIETSGSRPPLARASTAVSRASSRVRRPSMNRSKSVSTAIGSVPACCRLFRVSSEISRSSKERYRRLPVTQTSPAEAARAAPTTRRVRNGADRWRRPAARGRPSAAARSRSAPISAGWPSLCGSPRAAPRWHASAKRRPARPRTRRRPGRQATSDGCRHSARRGSGRRRTPPAAPVPRLRRRWFGNVPTAITAVIAPKASCLASRAAISAAPMRA